MEIGSVVECINDSGIKPVSRIVIPKKGKMYTVTGFCQYPKGEGIYIEECSDLILFRKLDRRLGVDRSPFLKSRFIERVPPVKIELENLIAEVI